MEPVTVRPAEQQVLAVDIGNTRVKAGLIDTIGCCCTAVKSFPTGELTREFLPVLTTLAEGGGRNHPVVIAGVVDHAAEEAVRILSGNGFRAVRLTPSTSLPIVIRYADPLSLGIDRIANALFAMTAVSDQPVIIISAGTALVIDLIADGEFLGGAILPGLRLQLESLHSGTDALPLIKVLHGAAIPALPATATRECMTGGVVRGAAAAVEKCIALYSEPYSDGSRPLVIATGGDWELLAPCISGPAIRFVPDATLIGIARSLPCLN